VKIDGNSLCRIFVYMTGFSSLKVFSEMAPTNKMAKENVESSPPYRSCVDAQPKPRIHRIVMHAFLNVMQPWLASFSLCSHGSRLLMLLKCPCETLLVAGNQPA
jgi:hypothetical protein